MGQNIFLCFYERAQSFSGERNKFAKECKYFAKERKVSQRIAIDLRDSTKVFFSITMSA